jgi:hypothetical protein
MLLRIGTSASFETVPMRDGLDELLDRCRFLCNHLAENAFSR